MHGGLRAVDFLEVATGLSSPFLHLLVAACLVVCPNVFLSGSALFDLSPLFVFFTWFLFPSDEFRATGREDESRMGFHVPQPRCPCVHASRQPRPSYRKLQAPGGEKGDGYHPIGCFGKFDLPPMTDNPDLRQTRILTKLCLLSRVTKAPRGWRPRPGWGNLSQLPLWQLCVYTLGPFDRENRYAILGQAFLSPSLITI